MIVGGMLVGRQKRHGSCGPCGRGAPELCVALRYGEYGGTGVAYAYAMRCGLPNSGRTMSAARTAHCTTMEIASARRRTRRSRLRCPASPSTRHPRKEPSPSFGTSSGTFRGWRHHTPPQNSLRVLTPTGSGSLRTALQKFCGADFLGVALDLQETSAALAGM